MKNESATQASAPADKSPAALSAALIEAAEYVMGPVPRFEWTRQVRSLPADASTRAWFDVGFKCLGINCVACPVPTREAASRLADGTYLMPVKGGWRVIRLASGTTADGLGVDDLAQAGTVYRVVPAHALDKLGWKQIRAATMDDSGAINKVLWSTLLINVFALVIPLYMNAIYDRVMPAQASMSLWVLSLGVAICIGLELLLRSDRSKALGRLANQLQYGMEPGLVSRLSRMPLTERLGWGQAGVEALAAWSRLRSLYWSIVASALADLAFTILFLVIIAWIGGVIVLVPMVIMTLAGLVLWRFDRQLQALGSEVSTPFTVTVRSFAVHQAINAEQSMVDDFLASSEAMRIKEQNRFMLQTRCSAQFAALGNVQIVLIVVSAFYLVSAHMMQTAGVFATILLAGRVLQPLSSMVMVLPSLRQMGACVKTVNKALESVDDTPPSSAPGMQLLPEGWKLHNISFSFHKNDIEVLKDVSLQINPGERVALVGPSGAGKSVLMQMLLGVISPTKGSATWAGAPLVSQRAYTLRDSVHYAWQGAELVGKNAMEYLEQEGPVSEEVLLGVINRTQLASTIARWPQGLLTNFSAMPELTQKTRELLSLARASLSQRKIILLDAPTESLDQQAERVLMKTVSDQCALGATLIVATDRTNLLGIVDRVIYLDGGHIRFDGSVKGFQEFSTR
ncbi:ATP-binding cassette domain-containing protein [Pseudomonas sp. NPDC086278]|uniref:ATP-binding cassette domain-containing protein n=1 Tax=Pseudomonas sp. NPDC086278 TaxID=3390646 RepID=UPI003D07FBA5